MSPLKVLMRGYAMTQKEDGTLIRSVTQTEPEDRIMISLSDGKLLAAVVEKRSEIHVIISGNNCRDSGSCRPH